MSCRAVAGCFLCQRKHEVTSVVVVVVVVLVSVGGVDSAHEGG